MIHALRTVAADLGWFLRLPAVLAVPASSSVLTVWQLAAGPLPWVAAGGAWRYRQLPTPGESR